MVLPVRRFGRARPSRSHHARSPFGDPLEAYVAQRENILARPAKQRNFAPDLGRPTTSEILSRAWEVQGVPPNWVLIATGVAGLLTVVDDRIWRRARHVVTIAHEGGHALFALMTGRRLAGIRLHSDTSGVTVSAGRPTGPGVIATIAAGYVTPSLLGLGAAGLLASGRVSLLLQLFVALLLAVLVVVRNGFGVVSVAVTMVAVLAVSWFTSSTVQGGFAAYVTWFLLVGGVRPVIEVQRHRRRGQGRHSDPEQLAGLTRLPAVLWVGVFGLVTVGCLALGALLVI